MKLGVNFSHFCCHSPATGVHWLWLGCLVTGYLSLSRPGCLCCLGQQPITEQDQAPVTNHRPAPATGRHLTWSDWSHHISDGCCHVSGCQVVFPPNSGLMNSQALHILIRIRVYPLRGIIDSVGGFVWNRCWTLDVTVSTSPNWPYGFRVGFETWIGSRGTT